MKTQRYLKSAACLAAGLAVSAGVLLSRPQVRADEQPKQDKGFMEKMEQWQNKMSETFRDTWKGIRGDAKESSATTASVDLREDKDHYTVRLNLPGRDLNKVDIKLQGEHLHIVAPAGKGAGRYEQTLALEDVAPLAAPKIERKQNDSMIVVTVAKNVSVSEDHISSRAEAPSDVSEWDRDVFQRMDRMRSEMNRIFEDAFHEFRPGPEFKGFFDEPRFGSSVDLKEEGDAYVVRAYLPERDVQFINVSVEGRTLKIEAKEEASNQKENTGKLHTMRKAAYSQILTLPGPVQSEKMKVDRKAGLVVVTLPKAT